MKGRLDKQQVAAVLEEIAELLEIKGENPFKTRAYQNAARAIEGADREIGDLVETGELRAIKGIGEKIAEKIETLVRTGKLAYHEDLKQDIPAGVLEMLRIPGLGPRKAAALHEKLGVKSVRELEYACHENRLVDLEGFGEKSQANILKGIEFVKRHAGSFLWSEAWKQAETLLAALRNISAVREAEVGGSLRRRKEVVHDVDLLAASERPEDVVKRFVTLPGVERTLAAGDTKGSVVLDTGFQIDLRVVKPREYPFALHYFTGSKAHNIAVRGLAQKKGYKLNEYGLWKGSRSIACASEPDLFSKLGLAWIPPEMREDTGEIDAAAKGEIPRLVEVEDLRGVFHTHSTWSDGRATIEQMAKAAQKIGLSYLGLSDHSRSAAYAGGLPEEAIARQHAEIDALNGRLRGFRVLKGIECDILPDGKMDYPDKVLARFDFVIGSVHSRFNMTEREMTARICRAIANPHVSWIGHPTGRLLLAREGYPLDTRAIIDAAAKHGKFVELNAHPLRQDVDWQGCRYARQKRVLVSINPDAHATDGIADIRYGIGTARRGWLTKEDVLNALSLDQVMTRLRRAG